MMSPLHLLTIAFVTAASVVLATIYMKRRRIIGNQGAAAAQSGDTVGVSSSAVEPEQSEVSDGDSLPSITSEYDVFLSFRGPDVRHGIVDHLYECMTRAGIRVFKDDEEIHHGEVIGGELERAIRGSRIYTVVFSRNYVSSAWCLRELDMMVDLHRGSNVGGKIILPIFYKVDPEDVKLRTKLYRKALDKYKGRQRQEVVKRWEEGLKTVGGISGWDSKAIMGEGRFVQLIVQDIVVKLRIKDQSLPDRLTGIDDRVCNMLNLLDCDSSGVRLVVLHGMGGIGKTTHARVIFNELHSRFEGFSFISDVRETSKGRGGIEKLQNKLSKDILDDQNARSCNYGGEIIQRIQCKRVLLVLDDVNELTQLKKLIGNNLKDSLGAGSWVIITTRDRNVCNGFVSLGSEVFHFYEMEKMDEDHALQLFSMHAFGTNEPPEDYLSLSKEVVETTGNLPLALEVIGGHLCCHRKELWESQLEKLKKVPQEMVFKILKVSYDELGFREREIFLDLACFGGLMPWRYADYLWEARDLYPKYGVKVLINKSLIKIDSKGMFWIHDQLRDMGREIIRLEGLGRPKRYTRLWDPDDALKIVLRKKVSKKIIAMDLGGDEEEHKLLDENFRGLSNLLYLHLEGKHHLIGDIGSILETLMWLSWWNCNEQLNSDVLKMSNLVVLIIAYGWRGVEKLIIPNLRVLEVCDSDMTTSPDVSCCLKLEIMVFMNCYQLKEIHHSVGKLESLTYMNISYCPSLRSLPEELCRAGALSDLIVTECTIEEVPESIGRLQSLRTLELWDNKIGRLPASICDLKNLLVLHAAKNPLGEEIPEEIGKLSALEILDLSRSKIRFLPATINELTSLKSLKLDGCRMLQGLRGLPTSLTVLEASGCPLEEGIPEEIGRLSALEELNLSRCKISFLPETVSHLTSLKSLRLDGCEMLQEVRGLPTRLTVLDASDCPLNEGIPEEIGRLSALEELNLSRSKISFLPAIVNQLTSLKSLKLDGCNMLQELRGLPTNLTYFSFLWKTEGLSEEIHFTKDYGTRVIEFMGGFESGILLRLKTLGWNFPEMAPLHTCVEIIGFRLTEIELGGLESLLSLTKLSIQISDSLLEVLNTGRLRGLRSLEFTWCKALVEIQGLEQLELLEELHFHRCHSICRIQDLLDLKRLKLVSLWYCSSLLRVPRLIDECRLSISFCLKWRFFVGPYSVYEGESSKIQLEDDDSMERGRGQRIVFKYLGE